MWIARHSYTYTLLHFKKVISNNDNDISLPQNEHFLRLKLLTKIGPLYRHRHSHSHTHTSTYINIHIHTRPHTYTFTYTNVHIHIHSYTHTSTNIHIHIRILPHTHTFAYTDTLDSHVMYSIAWGLKRCPPLGQRKNFLIECHLTQCIRFIPKILMKGRENPWHGYNWKTVRLITEKQVRVKKIYNLQSGLLTSSFHASFKSRNLEIYTKRNLNENFSRFSRDFFLRFVGVVIPFRLVKVWEWYFHFTCS